MVPLSLFVCSLIALASAVDVQQCPGKTFKDLNDNVKLTPCNRFPCRLKKGTSTHITIKFVPVRARPVRLFIIKAASVTLLVCSFITYLKKVKKNKKIVLCCGLNMSESKNEEALLEKIMGVAKKNPKGISNKDISAAIPELSTTELVSAINKLLQQGLFDLYDQGGSLIYRLKAQSSKPAVSGDNEEKVVYNLIEEAGNKGIWMRDIRLRSNLAITQVTKVLKSLEGKKVIKAVKCVNASKKKVYMLYNLEPDQSISGGPWYQDQDFESEYVDILNRQCLRFLQQRADKIKNNPRGPIVGRTQSFASAAEVQKYITDLKISNETLTVEHVVTILNTLVYDGKAESNVYPDGSKVFRAIEPIIPAPGLVQVPCGVCPLIRKCVSDGLITPQDCKYMDEWLEQS